MRNIRVIPVLLVRKNGLVKSKKFRDHTYVGDPINTVRIFNDKEVDELCILDIDKSKSKTPPDYSFISDVVSEAFMPVSYGGGISSINEAEALFQRGVEKVILNFAATTNPGLIQEISKRFGAQSVVVSIDFKSTGLFKKTFVHTLQGSKSIQISPEAFAYKMEEYGAGEILLTSIDREGTYQGYDLDVLKRVVEAVTIPVVANGGAGSIKDFQSGVDAGAAAVAAGSMFVFQRPHNAVLISYPTRAEIEILGKS